MRLTVDLNPEAARLIDEAASSPFPSRRAVTALDRYALILRNTALPPFTNAEWGLLLEAHGGTISEFACAIEEFQQSVADAMMGWDLGAKWGVDAHALLVRLHALDAAQTMVLVEQLERRRKSVMPLQANRKTGTRPLTF